MKKTIILILIGILVACEIGLPLMSGNFLYNSSMTVPPLFSDSTNDVLFDGDRLDEFSADDIEENVTNVNVDVPIHTNGDQIKDTNDSSSNMFNECYSLSQQNDTIIFTNPNPSHESYGIPLQPTISITVTNTDGNPCNCTFYTKVLGDSWVAREPISNVLNESISYWYLDANSNKKTHYWYVEANVMIDGEVHTIVSDVYRFRTLIYRLPNSEHVDLEFRPLNQTASYGDIIRVGLYAVSDDYPYAMATVAVILNWDPTKLILYGNDDSGSPYDWFRSFFPDDEGGDELNYPLHASGVPYNNGWAYYQAWRQMGSDPGPAYATPEGLLVTEFKFMVLGAGNVSMIPEYGFYSSTHVIDGFTPALEVQRNFSLPANILITSVPPVATDDNYKINMSSTLYVTSPGVLQNDYDPDDDPSESSLMAYKVNDVSNGDLTLNLNGSFIYIPVPDFYGTDIFTYEALDNEGNTSNIATVTIDVIAKNKCPIANNDIGIYFAEQNTVLYVDAPGVLLNDNDPDDWPSGLTAVMYDNAAHGNVVLSSDGSFTYNPSYDFVGDDSFRYQAYDGMNYSNVALVNIDVGQVNKHPNVNDDLYETAVDAVLYVDAPGVLLNDNDPDDWPSGLTAVMYDNAAHGNVVLSADGSFTYNPSYDFVGDDFFRYRAYDGMNYSNVAMVDIEVGQINKHPVVNIDGQKDTYMTAVNDMLYVDAPGVLSNDNDPDNWPDDLTAVLHDNAAHGTVVLYDTGFFVYTPDSGYAGYEWFTYCAYDGMDYSDDATALIIVNDPYISENDVYNIPVDNILDVDSTIGLLVNDHDDDDFSPKGPFTMLVEDASHGHVMALSTNGSFVYRPDSGFSGIDTFTYNIYDGYIYSNIATVTINVGVSSNNPPTSEDNTVTTSEDIQYVFSLSDFMFSDDDVGDTFQGIRVDSINSPCYLKYDGYAVIDDQEISAVDISGSKLTYNPPLNDNGYGYDGFGFSVYDGEDYSIDSYNMYIDVIAVNDPPVANNDFAYTDEDVAVTIDVIINDDDVDGDIIFLYSYDTTSASGGIISLDNGGTPGYGNDDKLVYTPSFGFTSPPTDTFGYTIYDGALFDTGVVAVTVLGGNSPPTSANNNIDMYQDTTYVFKLADFIFIDDPGDQLEYVRITGLETAGYLKINGVDVAINQDISRLSIISGELTFDPNLGDIGDDYSTFNFKVSDGELYSISEYIMTIDVNEVEMNEWECNLEFSEPGGAYDNVFLGEKIDAADGKDSYDQPKSPPGMAPYIRAWFDTDFSDPYDELWKEYKLCPSDYKVWNLSVQWYPDDYSSDTDITISWNPICMLSVEYTSVILKNIETGENIDMMNVNEYTFLASALIPHTFNVICGKGSVHITDASRLWNLISMPFNHSLDKTDIIVKYDGSEYTWSEATTGVDPIILDCVYGWDRSAPQHYESIDTLMPGHGYWIYSYYECDLWANVNGFVNDGFITDVDNTWNLIGMPSGVSIPKESLIVYYDGTYYDWNDAISDNNPTESPLILEYLYRWSRDIPHQYVSYDVIEPGYGYWMYSFYECSLFYSTGSELDSKNLCFDQSSSLEYDNEWDATIEFSEPGGAYDNVFLGEKIDAADGKDSYDQPKSPPGMAPYIRAWFDTDFSDPYDELWKEYKLCPSDYKVWNLSVQWYPDGGLTTTITIDWTNNFFNNSEYNSIVLYDVDGGIIVADMLEDTNYSFVCSAFTPRNFKIICEVNPPPTSEHDLKIESISGGYGVTATIKNTGSIIATNISWRITVDGGFFIFPEREKIGVINYLEQNESEDIKMIIFGLGLGILDGGLPIITVRIDDSYASYERYAEAIIIFSNVNIIT